MNVPNPSPPSAEGRNGLEDGGPWARLLGLLCLFQLLVWTAIPLFLYRNVSLDVAEIVSWGHEWQMGYSKHPPLIAWISEAARVISGAGHPWLIYLCGQLVVVATFWAVWRFARRLLSAEESFLAVLALAGTYFCTEISLEFNHGMLLLPFFSLIGWFAFEALTERRWKWWILLGCAIGLGMLTKYEMAILAVCLAGFIVVDAKSRVLLKRPHPYVALAISLLIFSPNLKWLIDHHFISLTYAQSRMEGKPGVLDHLLGPLMFVLNQLLYLLPLFLLMIPWLGWLGLPQIKAATNVQRWNRRLVMVLGMAPFALFLLLSLITGKALHPMWGIPLLPFVPILLLMCFRRRDFAGAGKQTLLLGTALMGIMAAIGVAMPLLGPFLTKKALREQFPGQELAARVDERWHSRVPDKPMPVIAGARWLADNIAYYSPERPSVLCDQGVLSADMAHLDEAGCPWTSIAQLNRGGGMLVWYAAREGYAIPAALRETCPRAQNMDALKLRLQTSADLPPVIVGVAIVPPDPQR